MIHIKPLQMTSQSLIDHQISRGTFQLQLTRTLHTLIECYQLQCVQ